MVILRKLRARAILSATIVLAAAASVAAVGATAPAAMAGGAAPCYGTGTPPVYAGTPPWGYRTGATLAPGAQSGSFARAYGNIDLNDNTISGTICQVNVIRGTDEQVIMQAVSPITFHTHDSHMWGYPGNEIITPVRITASTDSSCAVGTKGVMTMYASYNGVRSDSVQFRFPKACHSHNHLYHGPQVNAQVPPL